MTYYVLVFVDKSNSTWDRVGSLSARARVYVCVLCGKRKEKKEKKKNEEERVTMNSERLTQAVIKL